MEAENPKEPLETRRNQRSHHAIERGRSDSRLEEGCSVLNPHAITGGALREQANYLAEATISKVRSKSQRVSSDWKMTGST